MIVLQFAFRVVWFVLALAWLIVVKLLHALVFVVGAHEEPVDPWGRPAAGS